MHKDETIGCVICIVAFCSVRVLQTPVSEYKLNSPGSIIIMRAVVMNTCSCTEGLREVLGYICTGIILIIVSQFMALDNKTGYISIAGIDGPFISLHACSCTIMLMGTTLLRF